MKKTVAISTTMVGSASMLEPLYKDGTILRKSSKGAMLISAKDQNGSPVIGWLPDFMVHLILEYHERTVFVIRRYYMDELNFKTRRTK